jgi:hypothetical protein
VKKAVVLSAVALLGVCSASRLAAQQVQKELSIEESFLQEPIEIQIIREQGEASDRESKLLALEFIKDYLDGGNRTAAVREILRGLSLQGTLRRERTDGRLSNDYPEVRWLAAEYLSEFPRDEAGPILRTIVLNDEEPAVAVVAVRSLKKVQSYDEDTTHSIEKSFRKFDAVRPDDQLALAILEYYAEAPDPKPRFMTETINHIRRSPFYQRNVRDKAQRLIKDLMKKNAKF